MNTVRLPSAMLDHNGDIVLEAGPTSYLICVLREGEVERIAREVVRLLKAAEKES